eukprot:TRINITY_DN3735_c0_g1_i5.p1 TRINITY_DN3735_c0_g1~~TRINITY_DN3735_c0_g1_i5.p1  ORF type:complete len:1773 (-),score=382.13 TRINITY_DN3735_c0_g1_i5:29-4645(-)
MTVNSLSGNYPSGSAGYYEVYSYAFNPTAITFDKIKWVQNTNLNCNGADCCNEGYVVHSIDHDVSENLDIDVEFALIKASFDTIVISIDPDQSDIGSISSLRVFISASEYYDVSSPSIPYEFSKTFNIPSGEYSTIERDGVSVEINFYTKSASNSAVISSKSVSSSGNFYTSCACTLVNLDQVSSSIEPIVTVHQEFDTVEFNIKSNDYCVNNYKIQLQGILDMYNIWTDAGAQCGVTKSDLTVDYAYPELVFGINIFNIWPEYTTNILNEAQVAEPLQVEFEMVWSSKINFKIINTDEFPVADIEINADLGSSLIQTIDSDSNGRVEFIFYDSSNIDHDVTITIDSSGQGLYLHPDSDAAVASNLNTTYEFTATGFLEYNFVIVMEIPVASGIITDKDGCPVQVEVCAVGDETSCAISNDDGEYNLKIIGTSATVSIPTYSDIVHVVVRDDQSTHKNDYQLEDDATWPSIVSSVIINCEGDQSTQTVLPSNFSIQREGCSSSIANYNTLDSLYTFGTKVNVLPGRYTINVLGSDEPNLTLESNSKVVDIGEGEDLIAYFYHHPEPVITVLEHLNDSCDYKQISKGSNATVSFKVGEYNSDTESICYITYESATVYVRDEVAEICISSKCEYSLVNSELSYSSISKIAADQIYKQMLFEIDVPGASERFSFDFAFVVTGYTKREITFSSEMPPYFNLMYYIQRPPGSTSTTSLSTRNYIKNKIEDIGSYSLLVSSDMPCNQTHDVFCYYSELDENIIRYNPKKSFRTISFNDDKKLYGNFADLLFVPKINAKVTVLYFVEVLQNCTPSENYGIEWYPEIKSTEVSSWVTVYQLINDIIAGLQNELLSADETSSILLNQEIDSWNKIIHHVNNPSTGKLTDPTSIIDSNSLDARTDSYTGGYDVYSLRYFLKYHPTYNRTSKLIIPTEYEQYLPGKTQNIVTGEASLPYITIETKHTIQVDENENLLDLTVFDTDFQNSFDYEIIEDTTYGTPIFNITGGETACPYSEGTVARVDGNLTLYTDSTMPVIDYATYRVIIDNTSPKFSPVAFKLKLDITTVDGLVVTVNGISFSSLDIEIQYNSQFEFIIKAERDVGPYEYNDVRIYLTSDCSDSVLSEVFLSATFIEPCPEIIWIGDFASEDYNWVANTKSELLNISLKNPEFSRSRIETNNRVSSIYLQYQLEESNTWVNIANLKTEILEDKLGNMFFLWDTTTFNDGNYDLRIFTQCTNILSEEYDQRISIVKNGNIDHTPPKLFGSPFPLNNYKPGDRIGFHMDDLLFCPKTKVYDYEATVGVNGSNIQLISICEDRSIYFELHASVYYDSIMNKLLEIRVSSIQDEFRNEADSVVWSFLVDELVLARSTVTMNKLKYNGMLSDAYNNDTSIELLKEKIASKMDMDQENIIISDIVPSDNATSTFSIHFTPTSSPTIDTINPSTLANNFTIAVGIGDPDFSKVTVESDSSLSIVENHCSDFSGPLGCSDNDNITGGSSVSSAVVLGIFLALFIISTVIVVAYSIKRNHDYKESINRISNHVELNSND